MKKTKTKPGYTLPPKAKRIQAEAEAREEVKAKIEAVLSKMPRRKVAKPRKVVMPKESGPKVDETRPVMSSGVKPGYTVMVPKAAGKPRPTVVQTVTASQLSIVHRLQHPTKDRYYLFYVQGSKHVIVEKWEDGVRKENRSRTVEDARGHWRFLIDRAGYVKGEGT